MSETYQQINILLIGGTAIVLLLIVFMAAFIIIYQRRKAQHRQTLHQLELDRQQELLSAIINTQEKEREHFAKELHDGVGQMLTAMKMNIGNMKRPAEGNEEMMELIDDAMSIASQSMTEVRSISHRLSSGVLSSFGLKDALSQMCSQVRNRHFMVRVNFDEQIGRMKPETELAFYRIAQELLNNTIKYAHASAAEISLRIEEAHICFEYTDNGIGFDLEKQSRGIGLRNIETRAGSVLKGKVSWETSKGNGTVCRIEVARNNV